MDYTYFLKQSLALHGIPVNEEDLPYIQHVLHTIYQAQQPLSQFPDLNEKVPLTIVDPEVIKYD